MMLLRGFPKPLAAAGYKLTDPGRYQLMSDDFSAQINAFKNAVHHKYNNTPAAYVKIGQNQKFSKTITIDGNVPPKTYTIKARCAGNTFAHTSLTVSQFYP